MNCYSYAPGTGEYIGVLAMRESPEEPGVFLLPANATETPPPSAQAGYARCFIGGTWEQVEDHRGQHKWTAAGQEVVLTGLGPVPAGLLDAPPPPTLAEAKAAKQAEVRNKAEATLAGMKAEYCATEIETWDQQYAEAEAYAADHAAPVPLLTAIATARGQAVAALAGKIIANRAAWVVVSGTIVGQRLAYQDRLDAAQTVAEVEAISVSYSLPGAG